MQLLRFNLPVLGNIEIAITTDELAEFTKRQLFAYYQNMEKLNHQSDKNCLIIKSDLILTKAKDYFSKNKILGRAYHIKNNELHFANLRYVYSNDSLLIETTFKEAKNKWYKKRKKLNYAQCHIRFYHQILYPIFSLYTLLNGYYLVHGSLINFEGKNIIISGLDGVGKSSLSNILVKNNAKLYSDNFVLFNGKNAIPLNLAMRLDPKQDTNMQVLYKDEDLQEVLSEYRINKALTVDKFIVLYVSEQLKLQKCNSNLIPWVLYSNNAPEICAANAVITPFLINKINKYNEMVTKYLSVPMGRLDDAMELLKNDN